jgi:hypothetical protein
MDSVNPTRRAREDELVGPTCPLSPWEAGISPLCRDDACQLGAGAKHSGSTTGGDWRQRHAANPCANASSTSKRSSGSSAIKPSCVSAALKSSVYRRGTSPLPHSGQNCGLRHLGMLAPQARQTITFVRMRACLSKTDAAGDRAERLPEAFSGTTRTQGRRP